MTRAVVQAAVGLDPAAAAPIAGAVAKAVPEMAALASATAAKQQPKLACAIARAAAAAAPAKAGKIVAAVCQVVPGQYRAVAVAVAEVAPTCGKDILGGVAQAVPDLKPFIETKVSGYGLGLVPVGATLDQAGVAFNQAGGAGLNLTAGGQPLAPTRAVAASAGSWPGVASAAGAGDTASSGGTTRSVSSGSSGPPSFDRPTTVGGNLPSYSGNTISPSRNYARP